MIFHSFIRNDLRHILRLVKLNVHCTSNKGKSYPIFIFSALRHNTKKCQLSCTVSILTSDCMYLILNIDSSGTDFSVVLL